MKETPMERALRESQEAKGSSPETGEDKNEGGMPMYPNLDDVVQLLCGETFPRDIYAALSEADRIVLSTGGLEAWAENTESGRRFHGLPLTAGHS